MLIEPISVGSIGHFNHVLFAQAAWAFLTSKHTSSDAVEYFVRKFGGSWDVRMFWLQQVEKASHATTEFGLHEV